MNVIVEVHGGVVQEIYVDPPDARCTVVDWDNKDEGGEAGFEFPPSPFSCLPAETLAEYRAACKDCDLDRETNIGG